MNRRTTTLQSNHEVFENLVASAVDVTSIMVAYTIGITQSSMLLGLAYGIFDAIIVVWMRKPISQLVRKVVRLKAARVIPSDMYVAEMS